MKLPSLPGVSVWLAALAPAALMACGLGVAGTGPESDASLADASEAASFDTGTTEVSSTDSASSTDSNEASVPEAGLAESGPESGTAEASCPGLTCNGACIAATDCRSCSGAPLLCASTGQCMSSCQGCRDTNGAAMPIDCVACDSNHANPIGTCQYADAGSYCLSGDYQGQYQGGAGYQCACATSTACPGPTQVCVALGNSDAGFCLTCGEPTVGVIQGAPCKGGGTCQESTASCE